MRMVGWMHAATFLRDFLCIVSSLKVRGVIASFETALDRVGLSSSADTCTCRKTDILIVTASAARCAIIHGRDALALSQRASRRWLPNLSGLQTNLPQLSATVFVGAYTDISAWYAAVAAQHSVRRRKRNYPGYFGTCPV
jgi:hypothetical protein